MSNSYFDGGLLEYVLLVIIGTCLSVITLGLGVPWALCMLYRWRINHTVIEGNRLYFTGTGLGLWFQWFKWWLLTVITLGIYGFWLFIKLENWKTQHTVFLEEMY